MPRYNASLLFVASLLLQNIDGGLSFGLLKAFLSPPQPRITRIKYDSPRSIGQEDPFAVFDFLGLVKRHNYPAEEHNITTTDGYMLILHRIPGSPNSPPEKKKPIVFIQHGILASSDSWVLKGPGKDLAFLLADAGYDVWLGNFRGNTYSRSHEVLNPNNPEFWKFGFHEIAYYDIPAMVDYVLEQTGKKNLTYIGHSMGSTCSYVLLSTRSEYNKRIKLVISLAPVAFWKHKFTGLLKLIVDNSELIKEILINEGIFELLPQSSMIAKIFTELCKDRSITQRLCADILYSIGGADYLEFNVSIIPSLAGYFPAGLSLKTMWHFRQNIVAGKFRQYDYGYVDNFGHYKQAEPPDYNITQITAPVALFYGNNDLIAPEENVMELMKKLPNVVASVKLSYKYFNHYDFLWAKHGEKLLYNDLIDFINRFK